MSFNNTESDTTESTSTSITVPQTSDMETASTSTTEVNPIAPVTEVSTDETASTSTTTEAKSAETEEDEVTLSAQELLEKGIKLGTSNPPSFDEAIEYLSRALEASVAQFGDLHIDSAKFYLEYGKILLESSKGFNDVFARIENEAGGDEMKIDDKVNGIETDEKKSEGDGMSISDEKAGDVSKAEGTALAPPVSERKMPNIPAQPKEFICGPKTDKPVDVKKSVEKAIIVTCSEPEPILEGNSLGPRELAWELLETARLIYSKAEPVRKVDIGDIHNLLGDIAVEDGNFERGYKEYTEAIKIFSTTLDISDKRLAGAHQLAGICSLYDQQQEAAIFHYTAAAEGFNNGLTELLVREGVMQRGIEETEDIEFVDETLLEKIKDKKDVYEEAQILNGIINDLIERVEDIQDQMQADAENPQLQNIVAELAKKLAEKMSSEGAAAGGTQEEVAKVVEQIGFDKPTSDAPVTVLGTFGKAAGKKRVLGAEDVVNVPVVRKKVKTD